MNNILKLQEKKILRELLLKHNPSFLPLLDSIGEEALTIEQRESLREVILDEFLETGIEEDDEPNERGRMLEQLIDRLGHF
jgi:hypothetical protein